MKRIVIIGAGISGLTAGIYAVKNGFDVEIYEKNAIPGGECTGWDRQGFHIDNCIHWMVGCAPKSELNKIWRTTGAIDDRTKFVSMPSMYRSELMGESITLWKDLEQTRKDLLALSPEDKDAINDLIDHCKLAMKVTIPADKPSELMNAWDLTKLALSSKAAIKLFQYYDKKDTTDLMEQFKHPLIRCMLSDFCPKQSLAHCFPMAYGNFAAGDGGLPRGGSRAMAQRMADTFCQCGGKLFLSSPATKIVVGQQGRAQGVALQNGTIVPADYIIPACDIHFTYSTLLDKAYVDPALEEIQSNMLDYPIFGMFQVAFAVDLSFDAIETETMMDCSSLRDFEWMGERMTVKTYAYEPTFSPEGKQIVQVMYPLQAAGYEFWKTLAQRPELYREKKYELATRLMKKVEARFPVYEGKLRVLDCWTPVTYERYCNAYMGYNQAYTPTKKSKKTVALSPYVRGLDNVVLAGQWLSPPGGLPGAAIEGKFAVQRILKKENRKISI